MTGTLQLDYISELFVGWIEPYNNPVSFSNGCLWVTVETACGDSGQNGCCSLDGCSSGSDRGVIAGGYHGVAVYNCCGDVDDCFSRNKGEMFTINIVMKNYMKEKRLRMFVILKNKNQTVTEIN